jgi:hypothetical protein
LLRGLQDVNVQQANLAAVQRTPLSTMQNPVAREVLAYGETKDMPSFTSGPYNPVEQFQRLNQDLPDGVRFEPLDERTRQIMRDAGQLPPPVPQPAGYPSAGHSAAVSPPVVQVLEDLIQDESNAYIFYSHLSGLAQRDDFTSIIGNMAENCQQYAHLYQGLLNRLYAQSFEPEEAAVNTQVNFDTGLALAVQEENKSLRALADLQELLNDTESVRTVQNIINKKIIGHNMLTFIKAEAH